MINSDFFQKPIRAIKYIFYKDVSVSEQCYLNQLLNEKLVLLFWRLNKEDRAHSLEVLNRMKKITNDKEMYELALLHDIGKVYSDIGWLGRIFAALGINKSNNAKMYKNHEKLGIGLLKNGMEEVEINRVLENYINNLIDKRHELIERCDY